MIQLHRNRPLHRLLALLLLGTFLTGFQGGAITPDGGAIVAAEAASPTVAAADAEAVVGYGPGHVACALCVGLIVGLASTTIIGLVVVMGTQPELVFGCALGCAYAFEAI